MATDLTPLEIVYCVAFFLGFGFAIVSALLSGVFHIGHDGAGHADLSGAHVAHHDGTTPGENVTLSPVSPVTISMFITSFGATGLALAKIAHLPVAIHLPSATVSGFVVAIAVFAVFVKILRSTQASSAPEGGDAVGIEAEVITHIPAQGLGEIAYTQRESRLNATAKTVDGKELPQGAKVKIVQIAGNTFIVDKVR